MVDDLYQRGFERHYSKFTLLRDYIVNRSDFLALYNKFVVLFPHIHAVLALTVSSPRSQGACVALSASFDGTTYGDHNSIDNEALGESDSGKDADYDNNDDGDDSNAGVETEEYILGKKERAILEYFLAMIRLRSQKKSGWWSIVAPLAHYAKGHSMKIQRHPLHGSGVTTKYALAQVDKLHIKFIPAVTNLISNQLTTSLALDNFQQLIPKKKQTRGSSAVYHRAVAYFVKHDKAILLPVGAVLRSPLGVLFSVASMKRT